MAINKTDLVKIDKPFDQLEVMHIDTLANECGMYAEGYRCLSGHNTNCPGRCHTFSCPIAMEIDDEDPEWKEGYDDGEWMKQHSEFRAR